MRPPRPQQAQPSSFARPAPGEGGVGSIGLAILDGAGDDLRDGFASLELHRQRPPVDFKLGVKLRQRIAQRSSRCCAGKRRKEATELEQALVLVQTVDLVFDPPALFEVAILRLDGRDEALDDRQCGGGSWRLRSARRLVHVCLRPANRTAPFSGSAAAGADRMLALIWAAGSPTVFAASPTRPECGATSWVANRRRARPSLPDLAICVETCSASIDRHMSPAIPWPNTSPESFGNSSPTNEFSIIASNWVFAWRSLSGPPDASARCDRMSAAPASGDVVALAGAAARSRSAAKSAAGAFEPAT